eukprot:767213-Rhodomonas_salina.2
MEVLGGSWARARGATYLCVSGVAIVSAVWAWGGPAGVWASISWIASRILVPAPTSPSHLVYRTHSTFPCTLCIMSGTDSILPMPPSSHSSRVPRLGERRGTVSGRRYYERF